MIPSNRLDGRGKRAKPMKLFRSFKMSETTFNQISALPEKMQLRYYKAVCNYGINGIEPDFEGIEYSIWLPMRDLIDYSDNRSRTNSENGKKGGAPVGNNNRSKAKSTDFNRLQPTLDDVLNESAAQGFPIDSSMAQSFSDCGLDPKWLNNSHSFFELAAERIQQNYGDKPQAEQKALFISAVRTWDELRREYPAWKARKEEHDRDEERKAAERRAMANHPETCRCGYALRPANLGFFCDSCRTAYVLNTETFEWEIREPEENGSLGDIEEYLRNRKGRL